MPRIRYIKPDFFKDEDLAELSFKTRVFFAGLWTQADREGRLEDRIKRLKVEIMPYDNVDIEAMLKELATPKKNSNRPFIVRYEVNGQRYIQILAWHKHQRPHHTEKDSEIPRMEKGMEKGMGMGMENQLNPSSKLRNGEITVNHRIPFPKFKKEAILYLNKKTGKNFSIDSESIERFLRARYNEKRTLEEVKLVIDNRVKKWAPDDKMVEYLRPSTLFRATNFENYLAEARKSAVPREPEIPQDDGLPKEKPVLTKEEEEEIHKERLALQKKIRDTQRRKNGQGKT